MKFILRTSLFSLLFLCLFASPFGAQASTNDNVFGWAWSSNIGWISFNNCANPSGSSTSCGAYNYGVSVDTDTLEVSGYAWSSNIGWISFNPGDWQVCPPGSSGGCSPQSITNKWDSTGWARAYSAIGNSNTGGWDGWISLGGSTYGAPFNLSTPINLQNFTTTFNVYTVKDSGFWWGSEVIGWIDLNPLTTSNPDSADMGVYLLDTNTSSLALTPSSYTVTAGDKVDISWSVEDFNPTTCTGSGSGTFSDWQTTFNVSGTSGSLGEFEVPFDSDNESNTSTTFTLTCTESGVNLDQSITITSVPLGATLENSSSGSCVYDINPTLSWSTNDSTADCEIVASNENGQYSIYVNGSSAGTVEDDDFENVETEYTLICENGDNTYQTNSIEVQIDEPVGIEVCEPFFEVLGGERCGTLPTNERYGAVFTQNGVNFKAELDLDISAFYGYEEEPITPSSSDSNLTFSPGDFSYNGASGYNTVKAKYDISEAEYLASTNGGDDPIVIPLSFSPSPNTALTINLCPVGSAFIKYRPVYKPF